MDIIIVFVNGCMDAQMKMRYSNERKYNREKWDKIKKSPIKLVNFARGLFLDLQEIFDFDETIAEL